MSTRGLSNVLLSFCTELCKMTFVNLLLFNLYDEDVSLT